MAMDDVTSYIPMSGSFSMEGVSSVITGLVIIIILAVGVGILTYEILMRRKFNKKIIILEKINNQFQPTRTDFACDYKVGLAGDTVFYLKKHRKYLPTAILQTGVRTYYFAIREDLEWINVGFEDIDFKMRKIRAKFVDKEMRYARAALQRNMRERFDKPGFWTKYGGMIAYISLVLVTGIMYWLLMKEGIKAIDSVQQLVDAQKAVITATEQTINALDNLNTGNPGYREVPALILPFFWSKRRRKR